MFFRGRDKKKELLKEEWRHSATVSKNRWQRRAEGVPHSLGMALLMLIGCTILGTALITLANWGMQVPFFAVKDVVARGCVRLSPQEVIAAANITRGANIFLLNRSQIAQRVSSEPWVKEAFVGRELPARVVVEIIEKKPIAIIKNRNGIFALLDESGTPFIPNNLEGGDWGVPVLTGVNNTLDNEPVLRARLQELMNFLSHSNFAFLEWEKIAEINFDAVYGFSVISEDGLSLHLGFEDYEKKLRKLEMVFKHYGNSSAANRLYVDLSCPNRVFVRKRAGATPSSPAGKVAAGMVI